MTGGDDQWAVVIAPETAEEANRVATALRAGGFNPVVDYAARADRDGVFPVLVAPAEAGEAKGFLRGLRAARMAVPTTVEAPAAAAEAHHQQVRAWRLPAAGALAVASGLLAVGGGVVALTSMLQFLSSLRNH